MKAAPRASLPRAFLGGGLLLWGAALLAGCGGAPPNVLLIVIDTARADRFSVNGYERDTSPEIASLAAEGAVYENAYTPSPWTLPAHASLFTGLFPSAHGADAGHLLLDQEHRTLAEALGEAGYRTLGYVESPWVGKAHGFHQGFGTYEEIWSKVPGTEGEDMGAALITQRVDRWLTWREETPDVSRQPFFIFINYFEPHLPYSPPDPERTRFLSPPIDGATVDRLRRLKHPKEMPYILGLEPLDPEEARILSDLYDGEISYVDRRIGEVVDLLRRRGLLDRTIVVVTSDHGELIGEHGLLDHKLNVYEELLRIPLVLRYPPAVGAGQRIDSTVMLQDLFPTILSLAGIDRPGRSGAVDREAAILPGVRGAGGGFRNGADARGDPAAGTPVIAEYARPLQFLEVIGEIYPDADTGRWDRALVAYRIGPIKLHWASDGDHHLYDLSQDPVESNDLAQADPDRLSALAARVESWLRREAARPPIRLPE
jgi:arylsulfatase A-like enzyme